MELLAWGARMRVKPRTKNQWSQLVCEIAKIIQERSTDSDLKQLAYAIIVMESAPTEISSKMFEKIDRLIDQANGVPYETASQQKFREHTEKHGLRVR